MPPLSLYVHFPWCVRKCPYCDFNSHDPSGGIGAIPEAAYLDALRADLEASLPLIWGRRIHSIFIGGGTPSLISAHGLERLLSDVRALLPLEADCEITLEANPGTFEAARFAAYRAAGARACRSASSRSTMRSWRRSAACTTARRRWPRSRRRSGCSKPSTST